MEQKQYHSMRPIEPTHLPDELSEFVSTSYPPQLNMPVLGIRAVRQHEFAKCKYELVTCCYDTQKQQWTDIHGQLMDMKGLPILGWKHAMRWIQPR